MYRLAPDRRCMYAQELYKVVMQVLPGRSQAIGAKISVKQVEVPLRPFADVRNTGAQYRVLRLHIS